MTVRCRDYSLDILRVLGLVLIVLAHARPPEIIFKLRNFDVPLMVIVSGMSYACVGNRCELTGYCGYVWKRVFRIYMPVLLFLPFMFFAEKIVCTLLDLPTLWREEQIVSAFFLDTKYLTGVSFPFVWIFKVFILVAIMAPPLIHVFSKVNWVCKVIGLAFLAGLNTIVSFAFLESLGPVGVVLKEAITYGVPYTAAFMIGYYLYSQSRRTILLFSLAALVFLVGHELYLFSYVEGADFFNTQADKRPPGLYYLSYSFFISSMLYCGLQYIEVKGALMKQSLEILSARTMWIYLWHIPIVFIARRYESMGWVTMFVLVLSSSVLLGVMQWMAAKRLGERYSFLPVRHL